MSARPSCWSLSRSYDGRPRCGAGAGRPARRSLERHREVGDREEPDEPAVLEDERAVDLRRADGLQRDDRVVVRPEDRDLVEAEHAFANGSRVPVRARDLGDAAEREEADDAAVFDYRIRREAPRPDHLVDEPSDAQVGRDRHRVCRHEVAHAQARQGFARRVEARLARRRREQEPAEEDEPRAAEVSEEDEHRDAEGDEEVAEATAEPGADARGPAEVTPALPQRRVEDSPAVERYRGNQVEDEEAQVDVAEPRNDGVRALRKARKGERDEEDPEREGDERTGDGDAELRAGAREPAAERGHAAEQPEHDAVDLHVLATRLERMAELVQQDRQEEERGRDDGTGHAGALAEIRVRVREDPRGQRPDQKRGDDEQAPVHADANACDRAE